MIIRPYQARDAEAIVALMTRAVLEVGSRDYSQAQVEAWAARIPSADRLHAQCNDGRRGLVAVDANNQPLAYGDFEESGHIDYFYCVPEEVGRGVASALYDELEGVARAGGITLLYTEASEAARRLFLRKGFRCIKKRAFEIGGVAIHNYAMEKALSPNDTAPGAENIAQ